MRTNSGIDLNSIVKSSPYNGRLLSAKLLVLIPVLFGFEFALRTFSHHLPAGSVDILRFPLRIFLPILILLIPCLPFLCLWAVWRKFHGLAVSRAVAQGIRAGVVVLISFTAFHFLRSWIPKGLPTGSLEDRFDAAVWNEPGAGGMPVPQKTTKRQRMLGDLVWNVLPGKSRDEIIALLGQPDSNACKFFHRSESDLVYPLGWQRDLVVNLDSEVLRVEFDEENRFTSFRVMHD
jgi:hypothetical protein